MQLVEGARTGDWIARNRYLKLFPCIHSSLIMGRHLDHAVVLILGATGHGKSHTVNRLVGKPLLTVAEASAGSTTEVCSLSTASLNRPPTLAL
jgi:hypothetical protein